MNATVIFVLLAIVSLSVFAVLAFRRKRSIPDGGSTVTTIRSLDVEAFRNLVDPDEEAFLRANLPPAEFKTIQRERARASLAYVKELSNAGLQFARIGDVAQRNPDPEVAAWGKQVANSAIELRMSALRAGLRLNLAAAFPGLRMRSSRPLLEQYERASRLVLASDALHRVQTPAA